jgi:hypothetical protein
MSGIEYWFLVECLLCTIDCSLDKPMPKDLPAWPQVDRSLPTGEHPYLKVLPAVKSSPALARIAALPTARDRLLERARVQIRGHQGYAFVDVDVPCIVLSEWYFRSGSDRDLYLDLLHELTHLRQLDQGLDLWDERFEYVDRPTEIEGYAVAIEEGRRLGMTGEDVVDHLANPWMTAADTVRLLAHVDGFLATGVLPNLAAAKIPAPRRSRRPW